MATTVTGSDGLTYTLDGNTLTITGSGVVTALQKCKMTGLDASSVSKIIVGEGITKIQGTQSFSDNSSLNSVELPYGLTEIGAWVFAADPNLQYLEFPSTLTKIGSQAFYACGLTTVVFKGPQPTIDSSAFSSTYYISDVYSPGWANATTFGAITASSNITYHTGLPPVIVTYKHMTFNGSKIRVESAVRDGEGARINTNYAKLSALATVATSGSYNDLSNKPTIPSAPQIIANTSVSSWSSDNTYSDYPYRASVAITGVTASDTAEVVFALAQATSGDYAPVCETYAGGVYIYSTANDSITIPTIIIFKG